MSKNASQSDRPGNNKNDSLLITVREVASLLQISERSVWRLVTTKRIIPPIYIGRLARWRRADIIRWIHEGCPSNETPVSR